MKTLNLIAGLGGAIVLTALHESLKNVDKNMPRIDLVGEEALQKTTELFGVKISNPNTLYKATLAGDLMSNAAYFSLIAGNRKDLWTRAASSGLLAGLGAIALPKEIGLNEEPVNKSFKTKVLTISYYMAGAFATAAILSVLDKNKSTYV